MVREGASLALFLLAAMVLNKSRPTHAQYMLSGPPFCYQCVRNCDVELGSIVQCPGNYDQCATYYSDENFKRITARGCLYHRKGCSKLYRDYGYVCTCPEHFCNNRRLMPAFYQDPADFEENEEYRKLVGVDMPSRMMEENKRQALFPEGELLY